MTLHQSLAKGERRGVSPPWERRADDGFSRTDDYDVYLKRQTHSDQVRKGNGWKPGSPVPRWIRMPAH